MTTERQFPVQSKYIKSIPWDMIAPHEAQAIRNHGGQSLARLAERGGLSPDEALFILKDQPFTRYSSGPCFVLPRDRERHDSFNREKSAELIKEVEFWQMSMMLLQQGDRA